MKMNLKEQQMKTEKKAKKKQREGPSSPKTPKRKAAPSSPERANTEAQRIKKEREAKVNRILGKPSPTGRGKGKRERRPTDKGSATRHRSVAAAPLKPTPKKLSPKAAATPTPSGDDWGPPLFEHTAKGSPPLDASDKFVARGIRRLNNPKNSAEAIQGLRSGIKLPERGGTPAWPAEKREPAGCGGSV